MIPLTQCRWTGPHPELGRAVCTSTKLIVGTRGVPIEGCATCYCRDHEPVLNPPPRPHLPSLPPSKPIAEWPLIARVVAKLRTDADAGLGDTIARHLDRFGGDAFKRIYKRITKTECGCANRQQALNTLFPYTRDH